MNRHTKRNILWRSLLVAMLMAFCNTLSAEDADWQRADELNRQVDLLMGRLQTTRDTFTYFSTLRQAVETALQCDYYDGMPNAKGKVAPKYRHINSKRLSPIGTRLIDAGIYYYSHRRNEEALEVLKTYLHFSRSHLFKWKKDLYKGQAAYYLSLLCYGAKKYAKADHYADMALQDAEYAKDAAEVKVSCMKEMMVTPNDSARYLYTLLGLHDKAPNNSTYMRLLMEYYSTDGHEQELEQFALDETRKSPTNKQAWALLGETKMRKQNWQEALEAFRNAIRLDTTFVEAIYNKGICISAQAQQMLQNIETKPQTLPDSIKALLQEARKDFEQVARLNPHVEEMDWATPLYLVYNLLGEDEKAKAIKPKVEEQKIKKS